MGPVLTTQAIQPLLSKGAVIASLSARVGSIGDNRMGGWWSYRMSKSALNMATKNMANEMRRDQVIAVALHPGTTATGLSAPFQKNVRPEKCRALCEKGSESSPAGGWQWPLSLQRAPPAPGHHEQTQLRAAPSHAPPASGASPPQT